MEALDNNETEIVLFLIMKGGNTFHNKTNIEKNVRPGAAAVKSALYRLMIKSLVIEQKGKQNAKEYKLTTKGIEIANHLKKVNDLLKDE